MAAHVKIFAHGRWSPADGTFAVPARVHLKFFTGHGGFSYAHETRSWESGSMAAAAAAAPTATPTQHLQSIQITAAASVGDTLYQRTVYGPGDQVADYVLTHLPPLQGAPGLGDAAAYDQTSVRDDFMVIPPGTTRQLSNAIQGVLGLPGLTAPYSIYCFFCRESSSALPAGMR